VCFKGGALGDDMQDREARHDMVRASHKVGEASARVHLDPLLAQDTTLLVALPSPAAAHFDRRLVRDVVDSGRGGVERPLWVPRRRCRPAVQD
jgi:hypothetical protein